ncbi:MAG TPA: aldehyde dehydrogenase family protein, partial [Alphaproteobacteria bacterium]
MQRFQMYIDGKFSDAASGEWFETQNPYTGKTWALVARGGAPDAERAVEAAHRAFTSPDWRKLTATQRGALLRKLGDLVAERAEEFAEYEVRDNGKLIAEMAVQLRYVPQWY